MLSCAPSVHRRTEEATRQPSGRKGHPSPIKYSNLGIFNAVWPWVRKSHHEGPPDVRLSQPIRRICPPSSVRIRRVGHARPSLERKEHEDDEWSSLSRVQGRVCWSRSSRSRSTRIYMRRCMGFMCILSQQRGGRVLKIVLEPLCLGSRYCTVYSKVMGVLGGPCSSKSSRADTHQNFMGLIPVVSLTALFICLGLSLFNPNYCTSLSFRLAGLAYIPSYPI